MDNPENLFQTQISQALFWPEGTRISDNEVEKECGSPDSSNAPSPPHFLTLLVSQFHWRCAVIQGGMSQEEEKRENRFMRKKSNHSAREKVYMYLRNLFSEEYLPTQIYILKVVFSLFFLIQYIGQINILIHSPIFFTLVSKSKEVLLSQVYRQGN